MRARRRFDSGSLPLLLALLLGCGGGSAGKGGGKSGPGRAAPAGRAEAGSASGPLTEAECMRLLDHYLDLAMAEKRATLPAEEVPTAEQVARIRVSMREQAREYCIGRTERERYDCALSAPSTRALSECLTGAPEGGG